MSEMERRVARAIAKRRLEGDVAGCPDLGRVPIESAMWFYAMQSGVEARAAIKAMREPTEAMARAGNARMAAGGSALEVWVEMHDAALEDAPPAPAG